MYGKGRGDGVSTAAVPGSRSGTHTECAEQCRAHAPAHTECAEQCAAYARAHTECAEHYISTACGVPGSRSRTGTHCDCSIRVQASVAHGLPLPGLHSMENAFPLFTLSGRTNPSVHLKNAAGTGLAYAGRRCFCFAVRPADRNRKLIRPNKP